MQVSHTTPSWADVILSAESNKEPFSHVRVITALSDVVDQASDILFCAGVMPTTEKLRSTITQHKLTTHSKVTITNLPSSTLFSLDLGPD